MSHTTPIKPKKARPQHSMWLMLGGAMFVSLAGFAVIAEQNMPITATTAADANIQVVELPPPATASASTSSSRPSIAQAAPSTNTLRKVTRPVMRSHSSN